MADNTFKRYELKYMLDREQYEQIMSEMIRYMQPGQHRNHSGSDNHVCGGSTCHGQVPHDQ